MKILPILQLERIDFEKRVTPLRQPSAPVADFDEEFKQEVQELIDTFRSHKIAVGLAAPQVAIQKRFSVINIKPGKDGKDLILVNPKIVKASAVTETRMESCMSLPHFQGPVIRPKRITVAYQDEFGTPRTIKGEGFLARVLCHEIDHLDGILYVDKMEDLTKLEPVEFFKED